MVKANRFKLDKETFTDLQGLVAKMKPWSSHLQKSAKRTLHGMHAIRTILAVLYSEPSTLSKT
jgi:hypothetical protein